MRSWVSIQWEDERADLKEVDPMQFVTSPPVSDLRIGGEFRGDDWEYVNVKAGESVRLGWEFGLSTCGLLGPR